MKPCTLFLLNLLCCSLTFAQKSFDALMDIGYKELSDGKPAAAKKILEKALIVLPKHMDPEAQADFFNNLGVAYYQTGAYKKGLDSYERALDTYKKLDNDSLVAGALLNLGLAYKEIGAFKQATAVLTRAARISERYGNRQELSAAWNAIGNIQREAGNYEKALEYHRRALAVREAIGYAKGTADSYHNIGSVHFDWNHFDEAEKYLLEALKRKRELNNQSNTVNTLSVLGRLYVARGEPQKALSYLNLAYDMRKEAGNSAKAASSVYYLGTYYASIGDRQKALELFRQSQDMARSGNDRSLLADALLGEIQLLKGTRGQDPLVAKYEELIEAREQGAIDENRKEMARLEIEYDVERKEREIAMRREQGKLDRVRIENEGLRNQQLIGWVIGLSALAIAISLFLYQIRRRKKQIEVQNRELAAQKDEITDLHRELSHRTKNYFGLLGGILKTDRSQVKHPEALKVLEENIRRLEAMSLVQHYLLDESAQRHKEVKLDAYLSRLVDLVVLNLFPQGNDLKVIREIDAIYLDYDIAMRLAIALNELICNAIEHGLVHSKLPELTITVKQTGDKMELVVKDNGPGITEQLLQSETIKGQALITKLLYKFRGSIRYHNEQGCVATIDLSV